MLPIRALTLHRRAFRASRPSLRRPSARPSSPSPRRREMADEKHSGGHPRTRRSPHIRVGVHAVNSSPHHKDKATPLLVSKNREESLQMVSASGYSRARVASNTNAGNSELCEGDSFDICMPQRDDHVKLNLSLLERNREKRKELERVKVGSQHCRLQPGMILLKNYLNHSDQVEIIRQCQRLGVGPGGFHQPGYRDGAKLSLQMMCLGKNWDPQTRKYENKRPTDGAEAPQIPSHFKKLVEEAILASHALIKQHVRGCELVEAELPKMLPEICIVNFYNRNGRLGLHQDRDESQESLKEGLPVVSFSLGDSADFLYGESRDVDKATTVKLDNGDVLIFGGESRHIFHGVSCVHPNTSPKWLVEETKLRPGRLNLTFRQL